MFKKLLVFLLILLVCLLVAFYSLSGELAIYASNKIAAVASGKKVFLNFTNPQFGLVNFSSDKLEIDYPVKAVSLQLSSLKLSPNLLSLVSAQKSGDFEFEIFDGSINGTIKLLDRRTAQIVDLLVRDWQIRQMPYISMLSIESGQLSYSADAITVQNKQITEINNFQVSLKNFNSNGMYLPQQVTKSLPLSIPAFKIDLLKTKVDTQQVDNILLYKVRDIDLISSLMKLTGYVDVVNKGRTFQLKDAELVVELTSEGVRLVGPFLPVFSNQKLQADTRQFKTKFISYINNLAVFEYDLIS